MSRSLLGVAFCLALLLPFAGLAQSLLYRNIPYPNTSAYSQHGDWQLLSAGLQSQVSADKKLDPRLSLVYNLLDHVDLGLAWVRFRAEEVHQASFYIQWAFYEVFQRPALAVRFNGARAFSDLGANHFSLEILSSWGYRRLSLSLGGRLCLQREGRATALLWLASLGGEFQLIPGVVHLGLERVYGEFSQSYGARVSVPL